MGPIAVAKGIGGHLELYEHKVVICREGMLAKLGGLAGKDIQLASITSLQMKKPGMLLNGYFQIIFSGSQDTKGGVFDAAKDENTVMFKGSQQGEFDAFKQAVEDQLVKAQQRTVPAAGQPSAADEIGKLADLLAKGVLTEDEFAAKKKQLLGL